MEIQNLTCIECPKSCSLVVDTENNRVLKVSGNLCPKGEAYAKSEVENPLRLFTATILAEGLALKMIPVRTDKAIPKSRIPEAAEAVKSFRINFPVKVGMVVVKDFLGLGVNIVVTRDVGK